MALIAQVTDVLCWCCENESGQNNRQIQRASNVTHCLPMNGPTMTAIIPKITEYKPNAEGNL